MKRHWSRRETNGQGYAPDRVAALLWAAATIGIGLIWSVGIAKETYRPGVRAWLFESWSQLGYYGLDSLGGLLTCVGIHVGRRWGFVGKAFHSAVVVAGLVYFRRANAGLLIEVPMFAYCLLRLSGILGPRPPKTAPRFSYAPDRVVGYGFLALNGFSLVRLIAKGIPPYAWAFGHWMWLGVSFSNLVWINLAVARSRGWTPILSAVFCAMGVLALYYKPEERVQWFAAWLGLFYFAARTGWLGPRSEGIFGLGSE